MRNSISLYRLQSIDNQILKISTRINSINSFIQHTDILQQAVNQAVFFTKLSIDSVNNQSKLEYQMQSLRIKIEQTESNLYDGKIKNPKDLRDIEKELVTLKQNLNHIEDSLIDAMEKVENINLLEVKSLSILSTVQEKVSVRISELQRENYVLQDNLHTQMLERNATLHSIPETELATYEQLRRNKQGIAVCGVIDNTCQSCGTSITKALSQAARSGEELTYCPSCGRILFCA